MDSAGAEENGREVKGRGRGEGGGGSRVFVEKGWGVGRGVKRGDISLFCVQRLNP